MLYSVWNWNAKQYDLFESENGEHPGQRPEPRRKVNSPNGRGRQLESLLPVVPKDARPVGTSPTPKGRVALHWTSSAVGLGESVFVTSPWLSMGLIVGGVWLGGRLLMAIARRF